MKYTDPSNSVIPPLWGITVEPHNKDLRTMKNILLYQVPCYIRINKEIWMNEFINNSNLQIQIHNT